jgi:hypothetical protein
MASMDVDMSSGKPAEERLAEFDAKLAELRADPEKAAQFSKDLRQRVRNAFEDLHKRGSSLDSDPEVQKVRSQIKAKIESDAGSQFGEELQISPATKAWKHVSFDLWYATDAEFEQDDASGRHRELTEIFERAARDCAGADSTVCFHSHQTVREKNGDYFRYFYFGFL